MPLLASDKEGQPKDPGISKDVTQLENVLIM